MEQIVRCPYLCRCLSTVDRFLRTDLLVYGLGVGNRPLAGTGPIGETVRQDGRGVGVATVHQDLVERVLGILALLVEGLS